MTITKQDMMDILDSDTWLFPGALQDNQQFRGRLIESPPISEFLGLNLKKVSTISLLLYSVHESWCAMTRPNGSLHTDLSF